MKIPDGAEGLKLNMSEFVDGLIAEALTVEAFITISSEIVRFLGVTVPMS